MSESLQEVCAEFMEKLKRLEYWDKLNRRHLCYISNNGYNKPDTCVPKLFVSSNRESNSWNNYKEVDVMMAPPTVKISR